MLLLLGRDLERCIRLLLVIATWAFGQTTFLAREGTMLEGQSLLVDVDLVGVDESCPCARCRWFPRESYKGDEISGG